MVDVKLTKNELRTQQIKLGALERYLPTLQLKKARLQQETHDAKVELAQHAVAFKQHWETLSASSALLSQALIDSPLEIVQIAQLDKHIDNIAGVEIPVLDKVHFAPSQYSLIDSPPWLDALLEQIRTFLTSQEQLKVAKQKKEALEKELREVSIRVNLFEKVLIPKAKENIRVIRVFLGDQQLVAVGRTKVVKAKLERSRNPLLGPR